ncbi:MAG: filamentous haemagglutinin family protein [Steroidobacteraceae bacterium]
MGNRRRRLLKIHAIALSFWATGGGIGANAKNPVLPLPCAPGACGTTGPSQFITGGSAGAVAAGNALTVNQTTNSAILNWSSFNIGAGGTVTFHQPGASSIALNRIFQSSPSQILGSLKANGQVYLLNLNGFLFGPTSTVNVGGLLVSSLPLSLTDATFSNGILSPLQNDLPVFDATLDPLAPGVGRTSVLDANGKPVLGANGEPEMVQVLVQPGAQMSAADQGRLLLTGQSVTNGGSLAAPDGQVILAAGTKVYLQASSDPGLRGLVVEVDANPSNAAWNQLTGSLSAPRGNITMVGLAVNQDGRISATTSVSANGSIRLEAAQGAVFGGTVGDQTVASSQGGALTIGPHSTLDVLPELSSSATAVAAQPQLPSTVTLLGEQVLLQGGSIAAPDGNLTAIAAANPSAATAPVSSSSSVITGVPTGIDPNARLRIDPGTAIDLSGSVASLPVTANLVEAQLRSSELADDPTQRDGALHGQTVYVNERLGSPPIANLSSDFAAVPQTLAQRTEAGGNAVLQSQGDVVFQSGASLNVSGGSSTYAGGVLQESYLVGANGQLYPISTANPLLSYVGVVNPTFTQTYNKWGVQDIVPTPALSSYQPGYVQGAPAGSVQFVAPTMVLQGTLLGSAVNGLYQRTPSTAVSGGQLIIGLPLGAGYPQANPPIDYISPEVRLTSSPIPVVVADDAVLPNPQTLDIPLSYLTRSGFTSTAIYSDYGVTLPAATPLVLPAGSTLSVDAARVDLLSSITDPGGSLSFENVYNIGSASAGNIRPGVYLGDGVTLDVRGLWTNDRPAALAGEPAPTAQTWQNGGTINLGVTTPGALLALGNDDALRASGGAWVQSGGTLVPGTGGSISLSADSVNPAIDVGANVVLDGFGVNGAAGGTFSLTAPRIAIGAGAGNWVGAQQVDDALAPGGVLHVSSSLFSNYGFQNFDLNASALVVPTAASADLLTVLAGTAIDATVRTLELNARANQEPSAATLDGLASVTTLAPYLRPAASVTLSALPPTTGPNPASNTAQNGATSAGDVMIGAGASITTDAGGAISLAGIDSLVVDGTLLAPGGNVSLHVGLPGDLFEVGFLPTQRIELGSSGVIDVAGTFVSQPSSAGLSLGTLYSGGSVQLYADRGAVVADPGSLISISGTSASVDVLQTGGTYGHEAASTAGGSIAVHSGEAISLLGAIDAAAGVTGTSGPAAAGSLDLALTRSEPWWGVANAAADATFTQYPLTVELLPSAAGLPVSPANSNQAVLGVAQLAESGLDALQIEAGNAVQLSGNLALALNRQLIIDAPIIAATGGSSVSLSAPYLAVGYSTTTPVVNDNTATGGSGALNFRGNEIELAGQTVFQGTSDVSFSSSGDLQLLGTPIGSGLTTLQGSLTVAGNLTLDAARIYPLTATTFAIKAVDSGSGAPSTVAFGQTSANPGTPLSAGGALTVTADVIASTGTIYAPFGTIALDANASLTLGNGSLTSVSAGGLTIPYGQTQLGGQQWVYQPPGSGPQTITGVPSRLVSLQAPAITLAKQATVDLTGGGDLSAYEWVPGTGGTQDKLTSDPTVAGYMPGVYAILPSTLGQASPQDPQNTQGSTITPGESVYLSGGGGVAAGVYPLLPSRYATEPGALLIEMEPQLRSATPGSLGALPDGTPVVAGYLSYGSTGLHQTPGYTGFAVYPGTYANQLAQYDQSTASSYFSAAASAAGAPRPTLPADAGTFSLTVTNSAGNALNLAGVVRTAAASGGLAAPIEISASDLIVGTPTGVLPADAVSISGAVIAGWQPGSLLLGGTAAADGSNIQVVANTVTVGAGTKLTADQISLVANQSIDVQNGALLQSTSAVSGTAPAPAPAEESVTLAGATGDTPALLAVSDLNWLIPVRAGGGAPAGAATAAVDAGATLATGGSLSVDALGGIDLNGTLAGRGAEWSLGSSSIGILPIGASRDALSINSRLLAALNGAGAVRLASTGPIDVYSPVRLGVNSSNAPTLQSLILAGSSLNNPNGATSIQFGAQTLTLEGSGGSASAPTAGPAGTTLSLFGGELDLGPNALTVNGFASTRAAVSGAVIGEGTGALEVGGNLSLEAAGVTASAAAQTDIGATGALAVTPAAAGSAAKLPVLLGGDLTLAGATIDISGTVAAPAGIVNLMAAGALSVDPEARVSTAGSMVTIESQSAGTPGGSVVMSAGTNVNLSTGAIIDVSGAGPTPGGVLSITAGQTASVDATLKGEGGAGASGGAFSLDVGSLGAGSASGENPLTLLAKSLGTGGFNEAIDLRTRSGDLDLVAGGSLSANAVTLTADSGQVIVGGTITANSDALRGSLSLFGGAGVAVDGTLHADGGTSGRGGTIEIGAGQLQADPNGLLDQYNGGSIQLAGGTITTVGTAGDGTLILRAPALTATGDVAIGSLASTTLSGVGQLIVVPVLPFNTANTAIFSNATAPTAADFANVQQSAQTYMSAAGQNIAGRLAPNGAPLAVEAGVEIIAPGSLTLQSSDGVSPALDLSSWRFNGAPVDLTVRAAGDLLVANTVTDGFGTETPGTLAQPALLAGPSSSIHLVAGADLMSANPLAVNAAGNGALTLGSTTAGAATAVVRTGTGSIDLIAAGDIVIGSPGSGAFTAGTPAIAPGGTTADPYPDFPSQAGTQQIASDASGNPYGYGVLVPKSDLLMSFPTGGGNLTVRAGEDIVGAALTTPAVPQWQLREGGSAQALPTWGVNLAAYDWNFGTLGGGDLKLAAGRDALNVTGAAAGSLLPQYGGGTQYVSGGGLSFDAGRNIGSAQVFLANGSGSVAAGGALTAVLPSLTAGDPNVGSGFYLQSSALNVWARLGIAADGVFNPTALKQPNPDSLKPLQGAYFSYSDSSALNLDTVAGDVALGQASGAQATLLGLANSNLPGVSLGAGVLPGSFSAEALSGNIPFGPGIGSNGFITLYPSPHGQLDLLAAMNISGSGGSVTMSDAVAGTYATVATPVAQASVVGPSAAFAGNIHLTDPQPALVTAGGDITEFNLSIPKSAQVEAGGDITDLTYAGQNLSPTDQTVLMAGRDFVYTTSSGSASVGGPGVFDVLAGRNVSLGFSQSGIITTGNLRNPNLPTAQGADLTIATGLGTNPDFAAFLTKIIAPSPTYQTALVDYVEFLLGTSGLSYAQAQSVFVKLTPAEQRPLIDQVFFNELSNSGIAANTVPGAGFSEGYTAIDTLYPGSRTGSPGAVAGSYAGDLTLAFSRIYTLSGGNINLVVPGGLIDVGLANPPSTLASRPPSTLGIVAQEAGNIDIYSQGDVNVNASRIFTLGGGNILIWSDQGSIDAGRGAKTAVSAPPPTVLINSDGTVSINFSGAAAGSGIRTIQTDPNVAPGNVDLVAPAGTVNAGDAGIGAAGNINIAARTVVGLSNIQFGGTSTGVPAQISNAGASLSGASAAASSATNTSTAAATSNTAEQAGAAPLSQAELSWLDVFVTGLGEENCKPDDIECLKRQKTPAR